MIFPSPISFLENDRDNLAGNVVPSQLFYGFLSVIVSPGEVIRQLIK